MRFSTHGPESQAGCSSRFSRFLRLAAPYFLLVFVYMSSSNELLAEVFELENGSRIEGRLLNPTENPRLHYEIGARGGVRIVLPASSVENLRAPRENEDEYESRRIDSPDTVEGQFAMAEWCVEKGLRPESRAHFQRVLHFDPDHSRARQTLGYSQRDGRWTTQGEVMQDRGYVQYLGRWRLPQEVLLEQQSREYREREGQWRQDLRLWRNLLNGGRSQESQRNILAITDPISIGPLAEMLETEGDDRVRRLYIETLHRIGGPSAIMAIVNWAVQEPLEDLRLTCYDYMKGYPQVVDFYASRLFNADPDVINEAAFVLRKLDDPRAVPHLVQRVVTTHHYTRTVGSSGSSGAGFDNRGGISMQQGTREESWDETSNNQDVLDALKHLTGVDFGFDAARWRQWWRQQRELERFRSRRDL